MGKKKGLENAKELVEEFEERMEAGRRGWTKYRK